MSYLKNYHATANQDSTVAGLVAYIINQSFKHYKVIDIIRDGILITPPGPPANQLITDDCEAKSLIFAKFEKFLGILFRNLLFKTLIS